MRAWVALLGLGVGCDEEVDPCRGARIEVLPAALDFGDVRPRRADEPGDPTSAGQVPARRVLLFKNSCGAPLEIIEVCLIEDDHNGVEGDPAFFVEPPERTRVPAGESGGVRVTYDHVDINLDRDLDGERDADQAILVIQSNAVERPTLIVPLCGRILPEGDDPAPAPCAPPFTIPEGESLPDLCAQ